MATGGEEDVVGGLDRELPDFVRKLSANRKPEFRERPGADFGVVRDDSETALVARKVRIESGYLGQKTFFHRHEIS